MTTAVNSRSFGGAYLCESDFDFAVLLFCSFVVVVVVVVLAGDGNPIPIPFSAGRPFSSGFKPR